MASISSLGAGTSLYLQGTYDKLYVAEQAKLTLFDTQTKTYQAQFSAFGQLKTAISGLETATAALTAEGSLVSTSVTSTNTAFSATTASDAILADYTINVQQMAKAQVLSTGSVSSNTAPQGATTGGTRTITITQPGIIKPLSVTFADGDTSLNGIAKAINSAGGNVSASVIKANATDYRLMIACKSTGTLQRKTASQNAQVNVNGVTIERQSNTISDAMPGVSLNLKAKNTADETLSVSRTSDASNKGINDWVKAYNIPQSTIATVTKYVKTAPGSTLNTANGALAGDSRMRSIQADIRSMLTKVQGEDYSISTKVKDFECTRALGYRPTSRSVSKAPL